MSSSSLTIPILLLLLLLLTTSSSSSSSSDSTSPSIFLTICSPKNTSNPELFDVHFVDSMEKVFQNITVSGFAASSSSSSPNLTVFGLGQCFSYLPPITCQLCYAQSRVKLPHCLPALSARIYLDGCFLEYSDRDPSLGAVDPADAFDCGNATAPAKPDNWRLAEELVTNITGTACKRKGYYEVGSVRVSARLTVYGMAQCWLSLNESGCRICLEKARGDLVGRCLPGFYSDAKAMNAGCFVRYSDYPFYLAADGGGGRGGSSHGDLILAQFVGLYALFVLIVFW